MSSQSRYSRCLLNELHRDVKILLKLEVGTFEHTELLPESVGPTKLNNTFEKVNGRYVENVLRYNDIMRRQIFSRYPARCGLGTIINDVSDSAELCWMR